MKIVLTENILFIRLMTINSIFAKLILTLNKIHQLVVSFASTGGISQSLSLINPRLNPIENNNLVFDLTDSSLVGI